MRIGSERISPRSKEIKEGYHYSSRREPFLLSFCTSTQPIYNGLAWKDIKLLYEGAITNMDRLCMIDVIWYEPDGKAGIPRWTQRNQSLVDTLVTLCKIGHFFRMFPFNVSQVQLRLVVSCFAENIIFPAPIGFDCVCVCVYLMSPWGPCPMYRDFSSFCNYIIFHNRLFASGKYHNP